MASALDLVFEIYIDASDMNVSDVTEDDRVRRKTIFMQ